MRNKLILALIIALLSFYIILKKNDTKNTKTIQPTTKIEQPIIVQNETIQTKKLNTALKIPNEINQELSQQQFSSEPIVEIFTVAKFLHECKRYQSFDSIKSKYSKKQNDILLDFQNNCIKLKDDYPSVLELDKNKNPEMLLLSIAMQSQYANIFQKALTLKFMGVEQQQQFFSQVVTHILQSKSGPIIASATEFPLTLDGQSYLNQLLDILGTINTTYAKQIFDQAVTQYSCQFNDGISCSATSIYMLKLCLKNENACGMDVNTWFQNNHTKAHNRDIEKLVSFFEN